MAPLFMLLHYEKKGCFINGLKFNFWIASNICNSLYLHTMNANGQITWIVKLQLTIYMVQFITIQLQFCQNNSFLIIMQLHYNYIHDVMLTSLIVIHLSKFNTWCQGHENPQKQKLKEKFKSNFQIRNKIRLCDSKTKTQKLRTKTWNVQNKHENGSLLC